MRTMYEPQLSMKQPWFPTPSVCLTGNSFKYVDTNQRHPCRRGNA